MGGIKQAADTALMQSLHVCRRPAEIYLLANSPQDLYHITGGPVRIVGLFAHCLTAQTNTQDSSITIDNVAMQNAAVDIDTAIGGVIVWPLNAALLAVIIPNVLCNPMPTIATAIQGQFGTVAGIGGANADIIQTITGNLDGNMAFYVCYYKMLPQSLIAVA
jgi:hypothetical protein